MKRVFYICALILAAFNLRPIITSVAPLLHTLQDELEMSGAAASLLTSLPVLCMGLFAPIGTMLRARFGLERTIVYSLLLIGAATAVRGMMGSVVLLVASALIGGIGISIAGPMLSGFIKKYFPTKPYVVSYYTAALTVGAAGATAFSVPIYNGLERSLSSAQSITVTLSSWSVFAILALIVWVPLVRRASAKYAASSPNQRLRAVNTVNIINTGTAVKASTTSYKLPIRNMRAIKLTLIFGFLSGIFYSITAWISPIALSYGYSQASAAMLLTVFTLIQLPISFIVPSLAARFGTYRLLLIASSFCELMGIVMLLFNLPMLPAVICLGIGAGGLFSLALMLPIVETATSEEAGAWSAMSQGGGYTIGAMGPLLVGLLYDHYASFHAGLYFILVVILVMMTVQFFLKDVKTEAQSGI